MSLVEKQKAMRARQDTIGTLRSRIYLLEQELIREQERDKMKDVMLTLAFQQLTAEEIAEIAIEANKTLIKQGVPDER